MTRIFYNDWQQHWEWGVGVGWWGGGGGGGVKQSKGQVAVQIPVKRQVIQAAEYATHITVTW